MTTPTAQPGTLDGYGILVTGGGSGIGYACAERFAADGAAVTICGRTESKLTDAVDRVKAAVPEATIAHIVCDVTDEADVIAAVAAAAAPTGTLDGVVASAGGSTGIGPLVTFDVEQFRSTVDLNLTGTFLTIKHAGAAMARQGKGSIVGMSSIAGHKTHRWFGAYGPAKAGIDMLCAQAADEFGASGVRVNSIQPGIVATEIMEGITDGGPIVADYMDNMPLARLGEPGDIAALCRFLVGPESTWMSGQAIGIDGGQTVRRGPNYGALIEPMSGADAMRGLVPEAE